MAQPIGIVAGSAEGAALCYPHYLPGRRRSAWSAQSCGNLDRLPCFRRGCELHWRQRLGGRGRPVVFLLSETCQRWRGLSHRCGQHQLPGLRPCRASLAATRTANCSRDGPGGEALSFQAPRCLGTSQLIEDPVYRDTVNSAGIDHRVPGDERRQRLNRIIFDQRVKGEFLAPHAGQLHRDDARPERGRLRRRNPEL